MPLISDQDSNRIADAIAAAEAKTSGEIVAVVAAESSSYLYGPFLWAALPALVVPWPLIYFTWMPIHLIYMVQLAVFFLLLAIFLPRPNRYWLIPRSVMREQAHRRAVEQFLAQNLHTTHGRTGVLIYVSVAERFAEILADTGIDKHVDKATWQAIVDELTGHLGRNNPGDGFVAAISTCGDLLAKHYPPGSADPNELPDHLIVLE
ncbi:MAG: TPM domain-containing protein [Hyphomicrobium sp.]|nr:TPM domain-containing protein [Hyphomicrobium sp.]